MGCSDPDAGFDEAYELGRRGLQARAAAEPFGLDVQMRQTIAALIQQAEELRAVSAANIARANEPIRTHMRWNRIAAWWS